MLFMVHKLVGPRPRPLPLPLLSSTVSPHACLSASVFTRLPMWPSAGLPPRWRVCLPAAVPRLPACLPPCPPASFPLNLPTCVSAHLPPCLPAGWRECPACFAICLPCLSACVFQGGREAGPQADGQIGKRATKRQAGSRRAGDTGWGGGETGPQADRQACREAEGRGRDRGQ